MNINGKYKILDTLGKGTNGKVFKICEISTNTANQSALSSKVYSGKAAAHSDFPQENRVYALKLIFDDEKQCVQEYENIIKLNKLCNTTIKYYDICRFVYDGKEQISILMEYIDGDDLFNISQTELFINDVHSLRGSTNLYNMNDNIFIKYISMMIDLVLQIHTVNFVHRDIKMENIMITKDNSKMYFIDFATSSFIPTTIDSEAPLGKDKTYYSVGTTSYMSPELCNAYLYHIPILHDQLKPSDIWALGITIFTLVYNNYPFFGKNAEEMGIVEFSIFMSKKRVQLFQRIPCLAKLVNSMLNIDYTKRPTIQQIHTEFKNLVI
jgi:serine/threonine protein kinase